MDYIKLSQSRLVPRNLLGYYLVHHDSHGFFRFNPMGGVRFPVPGGWVEDPCAATKFTNPWEAKTVAATCLRGTQVLVAPCPKPTNRGEDSTPSIFETGCS